jgi:hypothetical protein
MLRGEKEMKMVKFWQEIPNSKKKTEEKARDYVPPNSNTTIRTMR